MACEKDHSKVQEIMSNMPTDQSGKGRHKCAACAYEQGFIDGKELKENINLSSFFDELEYSQAKEQRHKSPHAAYVKGYYDGVEKYYGR